MDRQSEFRNFVGSQLNTGNMVSRINVGPTPSSGLANCGLISNAVPLGEEDPNDLGPISLAGYSNHFDLGL